MFFLIIYKNNVKIVGKLLPVNINDLVRARGTGKLLKDGGWAWRIPLVVMDKCLKG